MEGEETTLLEQFFDENAEYEEELNEILNKLYVMGQETGCRWDNFTHNEGSPGDVVSVLKSGRLRLYCLYVDSTIVCFGSGGYKSPEKDIEIKEGKLNINFWDYED